MIIALAAGLVIPILAVLPASYVFALAGLAIFASLQDAFEKAFGGTLRFGALVAFAVAVTPFSFVGITSAMGGARGSGGLAHSGTEPTSGSLAGADY